MATFSKPLNILLIGPLVLLLWWRAAIPGRAGRRHRYSRVTVAGLFGVNALSSGEFNYQGGDRRTFYTNFPFDSPEHTWEHLAQARQSVEMTTNDSDADNVLDPSEFPNRFAHNVEYFLVGRHFGFVPYFFPGCVAIVLWLAVAPPVRRVAGADVPRPRGLHARAAGLLSVHVERGRRASRESLLPEPVPGAVLPHAADDVDGAGDAGLGGRRALHRAPRR